ncbi:hypothetical protein BJ912DRAFT_974119 [Pholiota molesta]|nr:hypothetical protein BJ912DRAFT_974119 [Pholiota molesta]
MTAFDRVFFFFLYLWYIFNFLHTPFLRLARWANAGHGMVPGAYFFHLLPLACVSKLSTPPHREVRARRLGDPSAHLACRRLPTALLQRRILGPGAGPIRSALDRVSSRILLRHDPVGVRQAGGGRWPNGAGGMRYWLCMRGFGPPILLLRCDPPWCAGGRTLSGGG